MFAPIRPRPTIASSISFPPQRFALLRAKRPGPAVPAGSARGLRTPLSLRSAQGLIERGAELRKSGVWIVAEVDAQHRQLVRLERLEVAQRLRVDEHAERFLLARDLDIVRMSRHQL